MTNYRVNYVNWGIANRYSGKEIDINKNLLNPFFLPLHNEILKHEMKHSDKGYKKKDLKLDVTGFKNKKLYNLFILKNPSSWIQFSPVIIRRGKWYIDISLSLFLLWSIMYFLTIYLIIRFIGGSING